MTPRLRHSLKWRILPYLFYAGGIVGMVVMAVSR